MNQTPTEEVARDPGYTEYACRTAIRDLIAQLGEEAARERIRAYLEEETNTVDMRRFVA